MRDFLFEEFVLRQICFFLYVNFIHHKYFWFVDLTHDTDNFGLLEIPPLGMIDHIDYYINLFMDSLECTLVDMFCQKILRLPEDSRSINEDDLASLILVERLYWKARSLGFGGGYGDLLSDDIVDKCRFADAWSSDD